LASLIQDLYFRVGINKYYNFGGSDLSHHLLFLEVENKKE
jgi:hypothetical protein